MLNERGLDRALEAGVDEVNVVVVATETFSQRNQGMSVDDAVRGFGVHRRAARARPGSGVTLTVGAAFGCPFEGEVAARAASPSWYARCPEAQEVALADTIGVGVPADVRRLAERGRRGHRRSRCASTSTTPATPGTPTPSPPWKPGAAALDASAGGIGGCPFAPAATGNIATEDLRLPAGPDGRRHRRRPARRGRRGALIGRYLGKRCPPSSVA